MNMCIEGSPYCDGDIRDGGYNGENVESASVVAIKSHSDIATWSTKLKVLEHGGFMVRSLITLLHLSSKVKD